MNEEVAHYDAIASALLSVGATMIAIIAGLVPIAKTQSALTERTIAVFGITAGLLGLAIVLSIFGLVTKGNVRRKRTLCVVPAVPLVASVILLILIIF